MKLFSKIATLSVGLAMAVGVGVAASRGSFERAKAESDVSWTATSGALGSGVGTGKISTGEYEWTYQRTLVSGASYTGWTTNCIQLGKNGGVENITFTTSNIPGTIKSVYVECSSYNNAHRMSVTVGGDTYLASTATARWTTISSLGGTGTSSGEIIIAFTGGTRALYIKSISVTYETGGMSSYTMSYNANGGTGTMTDTNSPYTNGATVTVLANEFTKEGSVFSNWNTLADGSGTTYDAGDTFEINKNTTLYAQWINIPSSGDVIMFNDNGGSDSTDAITASEVLEYISQGSSFIESASDISKVFKGKTGLKFGTKDLVGSITLNFADSNPFNGYKLYATFKGYGSDGGNFTFASNALAETVSLSKESTDLDEYEVGTLTEKPTSLTISTSLCRGYLKSLRFYSDEVQYTELLFSQELLSLTNAVCEGYNGSTNNKAALTSIWSMLNGESKYQSLTSSQKQVLADAEYDIDENDVVTAKEGTNQTVAEAMARYDYLTAKYGLNQFVQGRAIPELNIRAEITSINAPGYVIIIVFLTIAITAFGVFVLSHKKKEN